MDQEIKKLFDEFINGLSDVIADKVSRKLVKEMSQLGPGTEEVPSRLMTLSEAKKFFGFASLGTLQKYAQTGAIPAIRIGRRIYIDPKDLQTFIEGQKGYKNGKMKMLLR